MSDRLLTLGEVAQRFRCSTRTVRRRISTGELAVFRDRGLMRIPEALVDGYIATHTTAATRNRAAAPKNPRRGERTGLRLYPPGTKLFHLPDPLASGSTSILDDPPEEAARPITDPCQRGAEGRDDHEQASRPD